MKFQTPIADKEENISTCRLVPSSVAFISVRLFLVLGAEAADGLACTPDLEVVNLLKLLLVLLTVVGLRVVLEGALGLASVGNGIVEVVEDGLEGVLEALAPVNGTTTSSGGACVVHVVHTVASDQGVEGLGSLLNGLVESLRWGVAALTENLVLSEEHTVDTAHEATTLTVQVGVDFLLEGGLIEISGADGDTQSDGLLLGFASHVLVDGDRGVDATALTEERADRTAGALGGDEDDVDVGGDLDFGQVLEDRGETVGEVESLIDKRISTHSITYLSSGCEQTYLSLGQLGLDSRPCLTLRSIREQVHDNGRLANRLIDIEKVLARDPAVLLGLLPGSAVLAHTDNDVESIVTEVKTLAVTLRAVADEGKCVVLEVVLCGNY
jgi:hypothetical protein